MSRTGRPGTGRRQVQIVSLSVIGLPTCSSRDAKGRARTPFSRKQSKNTHAHDGCTVPPRTRHDARADADNPMAHAHLPSLRVLAHLGILAASCSSLLEPRHIRTARPRPVAITPRQSPQALPLSWSLTAQPDRQRPKVALPARMALLRDGTAHGGTARSVTAQGVTARYATAQSSSAPGLSPVALSSHCY